MALIICPECNSAVSEHADRCPTCGCSGDTLRRLVEERQQRFKEYRVNQENNVRSRAEYEWGCYMEALSEAADEYNIKFKEIEDKYAPLEKQLAEYTEKAQGTAEESIKRIEELIVEKDEIGLFGTKARNQLQKKIDAEYDKCSKLKTEIHNSAEEFKSKKNAEIDVIAEQLKKVENEQTERIESEVNDLTVRFCKSETDVMKSIIKDKYYKAFHIREMLEILGIMTKQDIKDNFAFADDIELSYAATAGLDEILDDQEFCESVGIGQKQVLDDFYYIALSDSAKDKIRQERNRAFQSRMAVLQQRIREYEAQEAMPAYQRVTASQNAKPASVLKRGAAGWIIAGPAGGIIGGLSAINKNITDKE